MEEIKLYEGKETLFFEPIKHQYFWNDELLPSATTITKLLTPVQPLIMWANKMASEEFKRLIVAGQKYVFITEALYRCFCRSSKL